MRKAKLAPGYEGVRDNLWSSLIGYALGGAGLTLLGWLAGWWKGIGLNLQWGLGALFLLLLWSAGLLSLIRRGLKSHAADSALPQSGTASSVANAASKEELGEALLQLARYTTEQFDGLRREVRAAILVTETSAEARATEEAKVTMAPAPEEPKADRGSTEKLLEVYPFFMKAADGVLLGLHNMISTVSSSGEKSESWRWMFATLVAESIRDPFAKHMTHVRRLMEKRSGLSESEFEDRVAALGQLLNHHYYEAWCWLIRLSIVQYGEEKVWTTADFARCHRLHMELLPELRRVKSRTDIGSLAANLDSLTKSIEGAASPDE